MADYKHRRYKRITDMAEEYGFVLSNKSIRVMYENGILSPNTLLRFDTATLRQQSGHGRSAEAEIREAQNVLRRSGFIPDPIMMPLPDEFEEEEP